MALTDSRRTSMVTGSDTTTYGYDYEDRLTSVTPPGSSAITYVYNGLGSRVGRGSETYRRAGASAGSPMLADGSASYTPGLSERRGGQSSFFHWGSFGDLSALSDGNGDITDTWSNDWFLGVVVHTGSSTTPVGAGGGHVDPDTGGINHGGGSDYEPWFGGGPSVAPMIQPEYGNVDYGLPIGSTYEQFSHYGHLLLDILGIIDPTGGVDLINAGWYLAEGKMAEAAISAAAAIPIAGTAIVGAKLAKKGAAVLDAVPIGAIDDVAEQVLSGGGVYVLKDTDGVIRYVGQTNDFVRRQAEWRRFAGREDWTFDAVEDIADPVIRTIKEQLMINLYGGVGGGQIVNSINAISKRSALFRELL